MCIRDSCNTGKSRIRYSFQFDFIYFTSLFQHISRSFGCSFFWENLVSSVCYAPEYLFFFFHRIFQSITTSTVVGVTSFFWTFCCSDESGEVLDLSDDSSSGSGVLGVINPHLT